MKKGKFQSKTTRHIRGSARSVSLILAVMLLIGCVVGGTVAWLVDKTEAVVNTFTYGDINITLEETDTNLDKDDDPNTNQYEMIPGSDLAKDPKVTVEADSEDSWLFVKLEKTPNFDTFLSYEINEGWKQLTDANGATVEGVYYREVASAETDQEFYVLKGKTVEGKDDLQKGVVTVKQSVTKEELNALDAEGAKNYPKLTITAYAVQKDNIDNPADAWKVANGQDITPAETTAPTTAS